MLSQQDDPCAQSRPVSEPLAKWDQSLAQWRARDDPFGNSSSRVRSTLVFKGELDLPGMTTFASGSLSPAWLHDRYEHATSRAEADGNLKAENAAFLLV